MAETLRTVVRGTRFTPEEWAAVEARAKSCGLLPAAYLRTVALGTIPRQQPGVVEREAVYHLVRIGNNLNQLARWANTERQLPPAAHDLAVALDEVRAAIRRIAT